jgi:predicted PolB exonuclease-like 3'-5' exonuclease
MENSNNFFRTYIKLRVEQIRKDRAYHERTMILDLNRSRALYPEAHDVHEADILFLNYHRNCIDQLDAILTELEYMLNIKD